MILFESCSVAAFSGWCPAWCAEPDGAEERDRKTHFLHSSLFVVYLLSG